jgi:hypothetical protein
MHRTRIAVVLIVLTVARASVSSAAGVKVTKTPDGVQLENRAVVLKAVKGSPGAVMVTKAKGAGESRVELAILGADGKAGKIADVTVVKEERGQAIIDITAGPSHAQLALGAGNIFVTVTPGKGAATLQVGAKTRYAVLPDFFADDIVYDPADYASPVIAVPAENFLLQLLEGEVAIAMLTWKGALDEAAKKGGDKDKDVREPKVALAGSGEGAQRRFTAGRVEFLGKPVSVAMIAGEGIWHEENIRDLPGVKMSPIEWKRPFDAKWRADFILEGFDEKQATEVLEFARKHNIAREKDNFSKIDAWEKFYSREGNVSRGFWGVGVESREFGYAKKKGDVFGYKQYKPLEYKSGKLAWPCIFRDGETVIAPAARWPIYHYGYGMTMKRIGKEREAAGKGPLPFEMRHGALEPYNTREAVQPEGKKWIWPIHTYGKVIIYPLDRYQKDPRNKKDTRETPLNAYTVVDVMRSTLGQGPCEYILDLDGQRNRKWLVTGKDGVRYGSVKNRKLGICPLYASIGNIIKPFLKENKPFDEKTLETVTTEANDLHMFMRTIWGRNKEYRQWGKDFIAFCEKHGSASETLKPVAEQLAAIARRIDQEMERAKSRYVVPSDKKNAKGNMTGRRGTGDEAMAYWDSVMPKVQEHLKSGDPANYRRAHNILSGRAPDGLKGAHTNACGDEIDWMVVRLRRMVREIRHKAGSMDTSDPEVARFCAKVREQCRLILRNRHSREGWDFGQ